MNAQGKFITTLLVIDTFLISYAVGFNSRHVLIIDPTLPPLAAKAIEPAKPVEKSAASGKESVSSVTDKGTGKNAGAAGNSSGKGADGGTVTSIGTGAGTGTATAADESKTAAGKHAAASSKKHKRSHSKPASSN